MINNYNTTLKSKRGADVKVEVSDFPTSQMIDLQIELSSIIIPMLAGIELKNINGKIDWNAIKSANINVELVVKGLLSSLNSHRILTLIYSLLSFTRVDGKEVNKKEIFDIVFAGEMKLLFEVLLFVMKSCFGDFNFFPPKGIGKTQ